MRAPPVRDMRRYPAADAVTRFVGFLTTEVLERRRRAAVITPFTPRRTTCAAANVQARTGTNAGARSGATETRLGSAIDSLPRTHRKAALHATPLMVPIAGER
jgi:hypothetical protein